MFTNAEEAKLSWLRRGPITETLRGCRKRCEVLACEDLRLLVRWFGCRVDEVPGKLYQPKGGFR